MVRLLPAAACTSQLHGAESDPIHQWFFWSNGELRDIEIASRILIDDAEAAR
jgi:hypothetical protein